MPSNVLIPSRSSPSPPFISPSKLLRNLTWDFTILIANGDYDAVWKSHCLDKKNLDSYAAAMYSLAVDHWVQDSPLIRDSWCYNTSLDYFRLGGLAKMMDKQRKKAQHASQTSQCCCCFEEPDCSICASVV